MVSPTNHAPAGRILCVDLLRTLTIILMIVYHAAYDLETFYGWSIGVHEGWWKLLARIAGSLFLLLVGLSFVLSWKRSMPHLPAGKAGAIPIPKKYLLRGLRIFGLGMLLTLGSYLFDADTAIRFGILHCIGISVMLLPLLVPLRERAVILGIGVIFLGILLGDLRGSSELLLPLNVIPLGFRSIDYYPLLPWSGVVMIGMGMGWRIFSRSNSSPAPIPMLHLLALPGRYSLWVYFVHQPLLLGWMMLLLGVPSNLL